MSAPTALSENFLSCFGGTVTLGSGMNTAAYKITSGTLTKTYEVADMTNNTSGGAYEDVKTVYKWEGDLEIAYEHSNKPLFVGGELFASSFADADGNTVAGNFRYNAVGRPMFDAKDGFKLKCKVTSNGAATYTAGS